jgi:predicted transcriptional regulator
MGKQAGMRGAKRKKPKAAMTPEEFVRIREALGLTQKQLAERTGLHPVTVAKYEIPGKGGYLVLKPVAELMRCLERCAHLEKVGRK